MRTVVLISTYRRSSALEFQLLVAMVKSGPLKTMNTKKSGTYMMIKLIKKLLTSLSLLNRNELRNFHELYQDRQMIQHTSTLGDVCYGDAGGSVWKYWAFRDGNLGMENRVHKLAVLTGVVSR